ncbi:hypothetical protein MWU58_02550 [Flavobacteriaceae bacterium S0825]|uniref:hypothetical protein n=1 Tax=Gaetbulibacter sp. S0825 TaxID=2720084 RepID=UPI001FCA7116|nr:hypothetical protein [Gaetbulibacter sp. S0825]MCK0108167.1 hypothetical protein [Flavobacteriaceae bacterium S0825]
MKKRIYFSFLVMLCFSLMSLTCSNDDENVNDNNQQISQIENIVESGTWRITNYIDSGENETSDFTGYNFSFNSDGSLIASNGTNTLTGTWSITDDSSSSDDDIDFNIFFPVSDNNDFEDLNDDWDIISNTSTKIELIDISGGNGGTDNLTFEKN